MADLIIKAASVITMDRTSSRAEAVAVDTKSGLIAAVGSLADVKAAAAPDAALVDLGTSVLMPGFIDPHSHPLLSGVSTQPPAIWIAPYVSCPTWEDVKKKFREVDAELPPGHPAFFCGLDRMLQSAPELDNVMLDEFFPARPAFVLDNSGHEGYFNTRTMELAGWKDRKPPPDPVGSRFGRNPDGTSNGRAFETAAELVAVTPVLSKAIPHPLSSMAKWFSLMSKNGITATTEHAFETKLAKAYIGTAMAPNVPLRVGLYHMSIEEDCGGQWTSPVPKGLLWKQGIKLWADGSPWVGTIATSFPYQDNETVRDAQLPIEAKGEKNMNYSRAEIDTVLEKNVAKGFQFAVHCNGDVGFDVILDAYEAALSKHNLLGTDHRWRVEHCGAVRADQFKRAASLGIAISLAPFQFHYWADLLDGVVFAPEIGSQWQSAGSAFASGASVSFHNDGGVSPPLPLLNVQAMVTRKGASGKVHGPNQCVTVDQALRAHTVNAAFQIGRDDLGSIEKGKVADFVVLAEDPYAVDPDRIASIKVEATYLGGRKVDTEAFEKEIMAIDPTQHKEIQGTLPRSKHCC
ncbi:amidohydrolase 3 [Hyaloraphidium curvatum]|nr:amidohydrolase 3 [Hyaloraphidium curvatum]